MELFCFDTSPERLSEAVFQFGQALTRVYDLTLLSRSNLGSTFYDDLADVLFRLVDEAKIQREFKPDVPNAEAYPVDYRIEGKGEAPLFLYGVPNRDKALLTTIMLSYFHRHEVSFESILGIRESNRDSQNGSCQALGRWWRYDFIAGVVR